MPDCEKIQGCPFFNGRMETMPGSMENYKRMYCWGRFEDCARRRVALALGKEKVPSDLYPNDTSRAEKILREAQGPGTTPP